MPAPGDAMRGLTASTSPGTMAMLVITSTNA